MDTSLVPSLHYFIYFNLQDNAIKESIILILKMKKMSLMESK